MIDLTCHYLLMKGGVQLRSMSIAGVRTCTFITYMGTVIRSNRSDCVQGYNNRVSPERWAK